MIDLISTFDQYRSNFISLAMAAAISIRIFYFETLNKDEYFWLNRDDKKQIDNEPKKLSTFLMHKLFKNKEIPTMDEGYFQIVRIPYKETIC